MFENNERKQLTEEHMENPKVGDRFSEMLAFWVYVLHVNNDLKTIITLSAHAPAELPKDGKIEYQTFDEFRTRFHYSGGEDYWVSYIDGNNDVEGWY